MRNEKLSKTEYKPPDLVFTVADVLPGYKSLEQERAALIQQIVVRSLGRGNDEACAVT